MRTTFIQTLVEQARQDERIFVITPDLGFSVLEGFQREFPERFLNVGIAEQNAVGVAAGLALSDKIVYVYSIIPFVTMRCFEQIRVDVAYHNLNVRFVGVGAGLSYGPQGATHHAVEDIAIMRVLPNMTVCCPGDPLEVKAIVSKSFRHEGPMYIRLGKNGEPTVHPQLDEFMVGKALQIKSGKDLAILTTSNTLELGREWVGRLAEMSVDAELTSVPTIKPIDVRYIHSLLDRDIPIVTLEEHSIFGGLGTAVAEVIAEYGVRARFKRIGLPDVYSHYVGSQTFIREKLGLTFETLVEFWENAKIDRK